MKRRVWGPRLAVLLLVVVAFLCGWGLRESTSPVPYRLTVCADYGCWDTARFASKESCDDALATMNMHCERSSERVVCERVKTTNNLRSACIFR